MTFPTDENGRYLIPAPSEPRVVADCDCGYGIDCPERVWDHISGQHAAAHNKGREGLPAASRWEIHHRGAGEPSPARAAARPGPSDRGTLDHDLARMRAATSEIEARRGPASAAARDRGQDRTHEHIQPGRDAVDRGGHELA